jgi:hypothetical protein
MIRYLIILTVWILAWYAPQQAGDWYDTHYHLYQASISLGLMIFVLLMSTDWWRAEFAAICMLQILHSSGDYLWPFPPENYNAIQSVLNSIEFFIIFGAGGGTLILRWLNGRNFSGGNRPNRGHSAVRSPRRRDA